MPNKCKRWGWKLDGKQVRKFLFAHWVISTQTYFIVEIEAFDKDHAVMRLLANYPHWTSAMEWEFLDELDPEHFVGKLGESLGLPTMGEI